MATNRSLLPNDRAAWLHGPDASCSVPPPPVVRTPWRVVLLGPPGVGKGTQAQLLHHALAACHLSTGDVFRAARWASAPTPALAAAVGCMARGELVPDATVLDVLRERAPCLSCHGGFILDGFPRTLAQAEALDALLTEQGVYLDGVVNLTMPLEKIVDRLSGRRTCTGCKAVYHVTARPPKVAARCDVCGGALFHREDDFPEAIRTRMATYEAQTAPLAAYYQSRQLLVPIDAQGAPEIICQATVQALRARRAVAA